MFQSDLSANDVCIDPVEDGGRKYKHPDEFEMFGKSIASQLRSLNLGNELNMLTRRQHVSCVFDRFDRVRNQFGETYTRHDDGREIILYERERRRYGDYFQQRMLLRLR